MCIINQLRRDFPSHPLERAYHYIKAGAGCRVLCTGTKIKSKTPGMHHGSFPRAAENLSSVHLVVILLIFVAARLALAFFGDITQVRFAVLRLAVSLLLLLSVLLFFQG